MTPPLTSKTGLVAALLIPIAVVALTTVLAGRAENRKLHVEGLTDSELMGLESASTEEALVSRDEAIELARPTGVSREELRVQDVVLGRYSEEAVESLRGRLVWIVSVQGADEFGRPYIGGPINRDRSCDWAWHYGHWIATIDAEEGTPISVHTGAFFDPSLPPTYNAAGHNDREYCESLGERAGLLGHRSP
jgi:hypothetical protein